MVSRGSSVRYNSLEHLKKWKQTKQYPQIHNKIYTLVENYLTGNSVLDLCCSTGLLGHRVKHHLGIEAIGLDADHKAIVASQEHHNLKIIPYKIEPQNMSGLFAIISQYKIDTLIARRCIPEIFGENILAGHYFSAMLAKANVKQIFLQGRVLTKNSTHPLKSVACEVDLFKKDYLVFRAYKDVACLYRK